MEPLLLSPLETARFLDEIGSPWVGMYLDVGNVVYLGYPEQWVELLAKHIKSCICPITGSTRRALAPL